MKEICADRLTRPITPSCEVRTFEIYDGSISGRFNASLLCVVTTLLVSGNAMLEAQQKISRPRC
jgi:hypothetical protein